MASAGETHASTRVDSHRRCLRSASTLLLVGQLGLLTGKPPSRLGLTDGRLKPPSNTPNSVSSQADLYPDHPMREYARIEPLRYTRRPGRSDGAREGNRRDTPGSQVVKSEPLYLYATMRTRLMKYTDDVEFAITDPAAGVIHARSSSRLGARTSARIASASRRSARVSAKPPVEAAGAQRQAANWLPHGTGNTTAELRARSRATALTPRA